MHLYLLNGFYLDDPDYKEDPEKKSQKKHGSKKKNDPQIKSLRWTEEDQDAVEEFPYFKVRNSKQSTDLQCGYVVPSKQIMAIEKE